LGGYGRQEGKPANAEESVYTSCEKDCPGDVSGFKGGKRTSFKRSSQVGNWRGTVI